MQVQAVIANFVYAILGGIITLIFMYLGFKLLDKITVFNTSEELAKDNRAVGMVVMGIFIGVGIAIGLVVGLGMN